MRRTEPLEGARERKREKVRKGSRRERGRKKEKEKDRKKLHVVVGQAVVVTSRRMSQPILYL